MKGLSSTMNRVIISRSRAAVLRRTEAKWLSIRATRLNLSNHFPRGDVDFADARFAMFSEGRGGRGRSIILDYDPPRGGYARAIVRPPREISAIGTLILNRSLIVAAHDNEANPGEPIKFNDLIYRRRRLLRRLAAAYCFSILILDKLLCALHTEHRATRDHERSGPDDRLDSESLNHSRPLRQLPCTYRHANAISVVTVCNQKYSYSIGLRNK